MRVLPHQNSHQFIQEIAQDLLEQAKTQEGLEKWLEKHGHVRLFAESLYGDSEEASLFGAAMGLKLVKIL